jgi:hypothetical protein
MAYLYLRWGEYMHDAFDKDLSGKRGAAGRRVWSGSSLGLAPGRAWMTTDSSSSRDTFAIAIICQSLAD